MKFKVGLEENIEKQQFLFGQQSELAIGQSMILYHPRSICLIEMKLKFT